MGFIFDLNYELGVCHSYITQQNRQDNRLEPFKTQVSFELPYFTDSGILYGHRNHRYPEGFALSDTGIKSTNRRNSNGRKGSWQGKISQPHDQGYLKKISQTTRWMLRRDGGSLDRLQGGYLPVAYILEHIAMTKRKVKREDVLTILRGGGITGR